MQHTGSVYVNLSVHAQMAPGLFTVDIYFSSARHGIECQPDIAALHFLRKVDPLAIPCIAGAAVVESIPFAACRLLHIICV